MESVSIINRERGRTALSDGRIVETRIGKTTVILTPDEVIKIMSIIDRGDVDDTKVRNEYLIKYDHLTAHNIGVSEVGWNKGLISSFRCTGLTIDIHREMRRPQDPPVSIDEIPTGILTGDGRYISGHIGGSSIILGIDDLTELIHAYDNGKLTLHYSRGLFHIDRKQLQTAGIELSHEYHRDAQLALISGGVYLSIDEHD